MESVMKSKMPVKFIRNGYLFYVNISCSSMNIYKEYITIPAELKGSKQKNY
jgi:hypothetical protein